MTSRALALVACLAMGACAGRRDWPAWPSSDAGPVARPSANAAASAATAAPGGIGQGAAPGDERGPGGFVPRREARSFYSGSGGQLWYYLNLYYWASDHVGAKDLWIKAEVVETFKDLKRWPDASAAVAPQPKTTVEYWQVGASGRAIAIDNHKDFWLAADNLCAGTIDVTITLQLGRFQVKTRDGTWGKPRVPYVLDRKDYGKEAGLGRGNGTFDPLDGEPINVWGYTIVWATCPARFVRSNWEEMSVPEIRLIRRVVPEPVRAAPVLTDDR